MYSLEEEYDSHSVICWLNYDDQPTVVGKLRNVEEIFANAGEEEEDPDEFIRKEPLTKYLFQRFQIFQILFAKCKCGTRKRSR